MFSKIKSLCKKFYKSRKSVASFVLAMMLAFSAFMSTGIKSEAVKYTTAKFYFNLSTISGVDLSDHKYFYVFKSTGSVTTLSQKSIDYYESDTSSVKTTKLIYGFECSNGKLANASYKYVAAFSKYPLFLNDTDSRHPYMIADNRIVLGTADSSQYGSFYLFVSNDGLTWVRAFTANAAPYLSYRSYGLCSFDPRYWYVMSSHPIRQIYTGEVGYVKNLTEAEIADRKNISYDTSGGTDTGGNITGGDSGVTGGSGSSGSGSSGSNTEEEKGFFASVKESLSNILTNIKELPSAVVNVPTTMINFWKNFIGSHSIGDIITAIMDAPSNIFNAWKSFFGSHTFLELLNAVKNVPATVSSWWKDNLPSVIQAIKDVPLMVSGWWSDHLPEILQAIVDTPTTVWNWWKEQLPDVVNAIIESPKTVLSFWKDFFNEHSFSDILQAIADAPKDILKFWENLFGSDSIKDIFKDLLDVPSNLLNFWDDTIVGFIESVESKFTFIEKSKSNIQLIIDRLTSMSNPKPPVITLPFSKTVMSKYGVGDIEMTFEWLAPYHELLMSVESACLYAAFCVRQFFDVKNMLNATSGATNVLTRL